MKSFFRNYKKILNSILSILIVVNLLLSDAFLVQCEAKEKKNFWGNFKEKIENVFSDTADKTTDVTNVVIDKTTVVTEDVVDKTTKTVEEVTDIAKTTGESVQNYFINIDKASFEKGWNTASKYTTATIASMRGADYVSAVRDSIEVLKKDMNSEKGVTRNIASESGFVAEKWHTDTYNIDAVANGSKNSAKQLESNKLASVDVELSDGTNASLKYYKDGSKSAKAQSKTIMQEYQEYYVRESSKGSNNIMTIDDFIDENFDGKDAGDCYKSVYEGQVRIIPSDQMDEATEYLKKRIAKESTKEGANRQALGEGYQSTLDSLADRLESKDGTKSKPLTKDESQAIAELCEKGEFKPEDFGVSTSTIITPKYVLKQSIGAGVQAAALQAALEVGPEVYTIIMEGIENGDIDRKQVEEVGLAAAISASEGFVEGSVSNALLIACQSGKLGTGLVNVSPQTIGTLTVLTIDAVCYGYQLSKGEITPEQYGDIMTEEIFVAIVSQTTGVLFQALLPMIPFSYMIGSMAGGMLASVAYEQGKEVVMAVKGEGGFELIVPVEVKEGVQIGKGVISDLKWNEKLVSAQNVMLSTTEQGTIRIKQVASKAGTVFAQ